MNFSISSLCFIWEVAIKQWLWTKGTLVLDEMCQCSCTLSDSFCILFLIEKLFTGQNEYVKTLLVFCGTYQKWTVFAVRGYWPNLYTDLLFPLYTERAFTNLFLYPGFYDWLAQTRRTFSVVHHMLTILRPCRTGVHPGWLGSIIADQYRFDTGRDCICTPNTNFRYVVGALVMQHLFPC